MQKKKARVVCAHHMHSKKGALRHKQLHAGRSDGSLVFLPNQVFHELHASSDDPLVSGFGTMFSVVDGSLLTP